MSEISIGNIESADVRGDAASAPPTSLPACTMGHPPDSGVERSPGIFDISDASSRVVVVCNRCEGGRLRCGLINATYCGCQAMQTISSKGGIISLVNLISPSYISQVGKMLWQML